VSLKGTSYLRQKWLLLSFTELVPMSFNLFLTLDAKEGISLLRSALEVG